MKNYLGIDYGTRRIGLALNMASLAEPFLVITNKISEKDQLISDNALSEIIKICQEKKIDEIVLGISEAAMALKIKDFAKLLGKEVVLPITMVDETLSSYEVGRKMKEANFSLKKRQEPIDHYSAALILEDFLENLPL